MVNEIMNKYSMAYRRNVMLIGKVCLKTIKQFT